MTELPAELQGIVTEGIGSADKHAAIPQMRIYIPIKAKFKIIFNIEILIIFDQFFPNFKLNYST